MSPLPSLLLSLLLAAGPVEGESTPPSFLLEVQPALSKAGCNSGACHGNLNGKGGFKLSLRGESPGRDHRTITREAFGRRIDTLTPLESLLLAKPSGRLPHGGGVPLPPDSPLHDILRRWIAAGAPGPAAEEPRVEQLTVEPARGVIYAPATEVPLRVTAEYSDGSSREVTHLAAFESSNLAVEVSPAGVARGSGEAQGTVLVRYAGLHRAVSLAFVPERAGFAWNDPPENNYIDRWVFARLRELRMIPSETIDDRGFLRRVYLDLLGFTPTAEEARRFLHEESPGKREKLIEELLARPEFADRFALHWADLLRCEEKQLDERGVETYYNWIREAISEGMPLDEFARRLVSARGSTYEQPPANYYRANRTATDRAENTARLFLGVRLQCAQCHNHPFDSWKQDDYHAWSAVFAGIEYEIKENKRRDKNDLHEFIGEQIVKVKPGAEYKHPGTGRPLPPRLLGSAEPLAAEADPLEAVAGWLSGPEQRQFARVQANRIWFQLFGRGLVEPVDDFRDTNPAVHPELLEELADDLIASGFSLRHMIRRITASRVYQLASAPNDTNAQDEALFSREVPRRLTAEQLIDSQSVVLGAAAEFNGYEAGTRAGQVIGVERVRARDKAPSPADRLLKQFGRPERLLACECERSDGTSLSQALALLAGASLQQRLASGKNRLAELLEAHPDDAALVGELYWQALSRDPSEEERRAAVGWLAAAPNRRAGLEDLAWALLNAPEFLFRH